MDINRHYQDVMQADDFIIADKVKYAYLGLGVKQDTFLALFNISCCKACPFLLLTENKYRSVLILILKILFTMDELVK